MNSKKARELFASGKEWITKQWKERGKNVLRINILRKTIGRNKGFIMDVLVSGEEKSIRYYAKIQSVSIDTVMIHYLLKFTKCGPDEFHIVLLTSQESEFTSESSKHGVITREAEGCKMALDWTDTERQRIGASEKLFRTDSFLLTFFTGFGQFGNLPRNISNWGFANWEAKIECEEIATSPSLMMIDFSPGGENIPTSSHIDFFHEWLINHKRMCRLEDAICTASVDSFRTVDVALSQARHIEWLHSKQTLLHIIQSTLIATERWLVNTLRGSGSNSVKVNHNITTDSVALPLIPYKHVQRPGHYGTNYELRCLFSEYEDWVDHWNDLMEDLFEWFPFPSI